MSWIRKFGLRLPYGIKANKNGDFYAPKNWIFRNSDDPGFAYPSIAARPVYYWATYHRWMVQK